MTKVSITKTHKLPFLEARNLAKSWVIEGEKNYDLKGTYIEGESKDSIQFSRTGLSGILTLTDAQFELELTLGFLFSAYQKKITEKINANIDDLLELKS